LPSRRIIPCLDVDAGRVVKGTKFLNLRDAGDPVELARRYDEEGADELVFLDITASSDSRKIMLEVVKKTAEELFIPFTVGGGIRSADDFHEILKRGADKVSVNTAAIERPELISEAAARFGSQCVVVAIDAKKSAPGMCSCRYSALGSRPAVGRCQLASKITRSGASRCEASQSVSTIHFLALSSTFPSLTMA